MNNKEKIMARLQEHYDTLVSRGYDVVGVFLQGSQNYGLSYEGSDIDSKAIVLPTFKDVLLGAKPVSTTLILENEEHIDVKDIRVMFNTIKKQNINFVEILFTEYRVINEEFADLLQVLFDNSEAIARMNMAGAINCMCGMALEKHKALEHVYPSTKSKIDKYGYDPKQLHHIVRMSYFLRDYTLGSPYSECLKPRSDELEHLLSIKTNGVGSVENARLVAEEALGDMKRIKESMSGIKFNHNEEVEALMDEVALKIVSRRLSKCLKEGQYD